MIEIRYSMLSIIIKKLKYYMKIRRSLHGANDINNYDKKLI